ncbi:MAG: helix-turn-helix transcriptional regulator [Candidatus Latescibacterota bacterium]|nr:MAG: helix-turn-helix transcriptional regulator [Candidatus Latescibacterota bacterium]
MPRRDPDARTRERLTSLQEEELAQLARGIAHPLRVRILRLLRERGQCVCGDLVDELPRAQSTVSQHLKILKESGLIRGEVEPPRVCYCADEDAIAKLQELVREL